MLAGRARVAALYGEALAATSTGWSCPARTRGGDRRGWFVYVVQLPRGVDRDATSARSHARGIPSKPYFPAVHLMSYYREQFGHREGEFPVCEDVAARSIALPFFPRDDRVAGRAGGASRCGQCSDATARRSPRSMSRFAEPQDAAFRALNDSLSFDWRLGPYDVQQSRAHATMLAAQGIISAAERDELQRRARPGRARARRGSFPFADGDEDIHMAIERRVTELAGPVGGKLHTARSRNDQVATDVAMFVRAHAQRRVERIDAAGAARCVDAGGGAPRLADARLHPPPARPAGLPEPPPARVRAGCCPRPRPVRRRRVRDRRAAARRRRARGRELRHRPRAAWRASSGSRRWPRTRSTPSPTATSCSTIWRPRPPARPTCRGSAPRSCCGRARSSASARSPTPGRRARRSCPRRRTPTPPSCSAPRRRASPPTWSRSTACMHGLPLTYNKDMQEDKEHLFDAADTVELCLDAADGMLVLDQLPPRAAGRGGRRRVARGDRRRRPAGPARPAVPRGARGRRRAGAARDRPGQAAVGADRRELAEHSPLLDDEFYAVLRDGAWLETKLSAGRDEPARACASSSSGRGPRSDEARVLRPSRARGGARPDRLRRLAWRMRRRDRRDRGLPRLRAGLPCLRRPDRRAPRRCSGRPGAPTSTARTGSTRA